MMRAAGLVALAAGMSGLDELPLALASGESFNEISRL